MLSEPYKPHPRPLQKRGSLITFFNTIAFKKLENTAKEIGRT